jgi:hypothetical protein
LDTFHEDFLPVPVVDGSISKRIVGIRREPDPLAYSFVRSGAVPG